MIPTTCPHGKDPRMCAYCDKKDTCDCRCDKNTDVIWGEITGELKDQTDLQAALDKHTADILTADTLAHSNEQRLDTVEGTANEANQRSKDNLTRLDSVEGTANATKALADVHTTRLNNVEGVANEANTRSQDNMKRLDQVEGVANGAQALANNHTELLNKANTAIADLIEQDKSHSESIEELTHTCETLQSNANDTAETIAEHAQQIEDLKNRPTTGSSDISVTDTDNGDLEFADESGNVVMRLANGHIKTKNFDSETLQSNANEDTVIIY